MFLATAPTFSSVLWATIQSPVQVHYSHLMHGLKQQNITVNRKMLSELAMQEPYSFKALVEQVRYMRGEAGDAAQTQ